MGVATIVNKMREDRLRWFGHDLRREEIEAVRLVKEMCVEAKGGRSQKRWLHVIDV